MADIDQERLLNDLLRGIADEDRQLEARHVEARVLEACRAHASARVPSSLYRRAVVICAVAAAVALVAVATLRPRTVPGRDAVQTKPSVTEEVVASHETAPPPAPARKSRRPKPSPPAPAVVTAETSEQPVLPEAPIEFVPLMPMTPQELTGSFQIVRVQMPRASLGPLRSPLEPPSELVEADVLLGEDGTARAIRLSTNGSIYPWRSR